MKEGDRIAEAIASEARDRTCPFMSDICPKDNCMLWSKSAHSCSFVCIGDWLKEIEKTLDTWPERRKP